MARIARRRGNRRSSIAADGGERADRPGAARDRRGERPRVGGRLPTEAIGPGRGQRRAVSRRAATPSVTTSRAGWTPGWSGGRWLERWQPGRHAADRTPATRCAVAWARWSAPWPRQRAADADRPPDASADRLRPGRRRVRGGCLAVDSAGPAGAGHARGRRHADRARRSRRARADQYCRAWPGSLTTDGQLPEPGAVQRPNATIT